MFPSLKNRMLYVFFVSGFSGLASADIILDNPYLTGVVQNKPIPSIYFVPGYVPQTEPSFLIQRSQAWRTYKKNSPETGYLLAYPPVYGVSVGSPTSERQYQVRRNISRANAYRLDYYKR